MGQHGPRQNKLSERPSSRSIRSRTPYIVSGTRCFIYALPTAHRGEEVSADLLEDSRYSVVWEEAENRLRKSAAVVLLGNSKQSIAQRLRPNPQVDVNIDCLGCTGANSATV